MVICGKIFKLKKSHNHVWNILINSVWLITMLTCFSGCCRLRTDLVAGGHLSTSQLTVRRPGRPAAAAAAVAGSTPTDSARPQADGCRRAGSGVGLLATAPWRRKSDTVTYRFIASWRV